MHPDKLKSGPQRAAFFMCQQASIKLSCYIVSWRFTIEWGTVVHLTLKACPMTRTYLLLFLLFSIVFISCEKEGSVDTTNGSGGAGSGVRLARLVYQFTSADSSVTELRYDASGRFIGYVAPNGEPLMGDHLAFTINRNSTGIIQSYTYRDATTTGTEETTYNVFYNTARRQYTHKQANLVDSLGNPYVDSTVFVYSGQRIDSTRYFFKEPAGGISEEVSKAKFTYDATGNMQSMSLLGSDLLSPGLVPIFELGFLYDQKLNPLPLSVEGIVTDQLFFISPANFTRVSIRNLQVPNSPALDLISATYTYRADNRPEKAIISVNGKQLQIFYRYN